jgi:hypothetical protein
MSDSVTRRRIRDHIEKTLGPITKEWEHRADGSQLPFAIAQVDDQPMSGAVSYVTMGLSDWELRFPSGTPARQELVIACHRKHAVENVQGLLAGLAVERSQSRRALARGEVEGPAGPLLPTTELQALYASLPVYFTESFSKDASTTPPTHFMWLVPISVEEASFVSRQGWNAFEDLLVKQDPDLLDLTRHKVRVPPIQLVK